MKMYYDFEHDEFLTEKDLKRFYDLMTEEEKSEYDYNVNYYIECCLLKNNGCCYTLEEYENELKNALSKIHIDEYSIYDIVNKATILQELYEFKAKNEK